jgi:hypothetical protein
MGPLFSLRCHAWRLQDKLGAPRSFLAAYRKAELALDGSRELYTLLDGFQLNNHTILDWLRIAMTPGPPPTAMLASPAA